MITIKKIIIIETDKKINEVLSVKDCNFNIKKDNLNRFRNTIKLNHKLADNHNINVCFIYSENGNTGNN